MEALYDDARPYMSDSETSDGDLYEDEPLPESNKNQNTVDSEQIYENADVIIQEMQNKEKKERDSGQMEGPPDLPPVHPEGLRLKLTQGVLPGAGGNQAGARSPVRSRSPGIKRKNPLASSQTSTPPAGAQGGSSPGTGVLLLWGATVTESYVDEVEYLEMEAPPDDNNNKHQGVPPVKQNTDHQRARVPETNTESEHQGESGDEDEVTIATRD